MLGASQAPPNFWKVPGLPRKFPQLPRKFFGAFPGSSLTVELNSNPGVPQKFPRLLRKFRALANDALVLSSKIWKKNIGDGGHRRKINPRSLGHIFTRSPCRNRWRFSESNFLFPGAPPIENKIEQRSQILWLGTLEFFFFSLHFFLFFWQGQFWDQCGEHFFPNFGPEGQNPLFFARSMRSQHS